MLVRLICPFLYSILLGCVWGGWFNKKFSSSLPVAFMSHILIVLFCGLFFGRLSIGIYGGIVLAVGCAIILIIKNRNKLSKDSIKQYLFDIWNNGLFIFSILYVFCIISNLGKRFIAWDEFSHWGMFLKESLRLDGLYCMSPLSFVHKDYVPGITLFEVIWCKLNGRYAEADAYRAIQIFMFSLLMPMFEEISEYVKENIRISTNTIKNIKYRLFQLVAVIIVMLIPLVFSVSNAFYFYHSIYCDVAVGIVFFWCIFDAYKEHDNISYQLIELTIGLTVLVLSKMTAIALLPLVVAIFVVKSLLTENGRIRIKYCLLTLPLVVVPMVLWLGYNKYVDKYVENTGNIQSYDGMKLSLLREVFISPENSAITYLKSVTDTYVDAIIHRDILIHGSYATIVVTIVIAFFILASLCDDNRDRIKAMLAGIWTMLSGIFYALLMFFLYCTAFSEYEAVKLASYERYMNSFVIAVLFFLLAVYFDSNIWKKSVKGYYLILVFLFLDLSFFHAEAYDQVLPGIIMHDSERISEYTSKADLIISTTNETEKVFIVKRGDNGDFIWHQKYYCSPRIIEGGSIGPAVYDGDIWSIDKTTEEFVDSVKGYDYIYFCELDDAFNESYSTAFVNPELLVNGTIYRITNIDKQIHLDM